MKLKTKQILLLKNVGLAFLIASAIFFLSTKGFLKRLEVAEFDYSFRLKGTGVCNPNIVIIEITDDDIAAVGRWPWERAWHAALTKALYELGAKYIFFDIIFSEPSTEQNDTLFEEAIKLAKNVYLPFAFQGDSTNIKEAIFPIERFATYVRGIGASNIYPDIDGHLRTLPLVFVDKKNIYPHMALKIAMDYLGLEIVKVTDDYIILSGPKEKLKIPTIQKHKMLINWQGRWEHTFKHYSYLDILAAYQDFLQKKKPKINLSDFKDSICMVGLTAIGLYDIKPVPVQSAYPGLGVVATALDNLIDKDFLYDLPDWVNILLLYILCIIPAFLVSGEKPFKETSIAFLIGVGFFIIHFILFKNGLVIAVVDPLIGLFGSSVSVSIYNFVRISLEKQRFFKMAVTDGLTGLFNIRYFKMLLETEIETAKSDPTKQFCIVMSDVDHFKHFNDTYGHQVGDLVLKEVAAVLKSSARSSDIVARYGGEEMIVLLRGTTLKDALNIAEKLRKNIENHQLKDEKNTYKVTASLGVSMFRPSDDVDTLIKRADDGLYKSKEGGRNRVSTVEEQ